MAKYIVTGVAGFIASQVATQLLTAGDEVIGVDNLNDAYDVRIKDWRLKQLEKYDRFTFLKLDIGETEQLRASELPQLFRGAEAVINLAARAGVRQSVLNPWVYFQTNQNGTLNLLELSKEYKVKKFVLASTSSIYGANAPFPTPETADSSSPLQPYAASKKAAEVLAYAYHSLYGIDATVVRYFTVYGPAGRPDMSIMRFISRISDGLPIHLFGTGEQTRGFTYVTDIARGTILAATTPLGYEIINLGGHEQISINNLITKIEEIVGKKAIIEKFPRNLAEMDANLADDSKAMKLLSWSPQVSLAEGLKNAVAWYNKEHSWASKLDLGM